MKSNDPDQLNLFYDVQEVRANLVRYSGGGPSLSTKPAVAVAADQTPIRLQPGRDDQYGTYPWIIKQHTGEGAGGWRHLAKFDSEQGAKEAYDRMLESGLYLAG